MSPSLLASLISSYCRSMPLYRKGLVTREMSMVALKWNDLVQIQRSATSMWFYKTEHDMKKTFSPMQFSTLRLLTEDKEKYAGWVQKTKANIVDMVAAFCGDGFKVSVSYITEQNSFCVTIIGTDNTKQHKECCMTTWSDDLEEAILMAGYKHYAMCDGAAWPMQETAQRWG